MIKNFFLYICIFFINLCSAQQIVSNDIFGFATSNTFSYFNIHDSIFQKNIKEISPKLLRFPGGAVGNFYHFNQSAYGLDIKEIDSLISGKFPKRARGLISYSKRKGHKKNYIDDFILLAKLTKARVVVVANVLTESNKNILAMINKLHENDINIIGVELGSELSNKSYFDKGYTIDDYIKRCKNLSQYIKETFPNMKMAIVAAPIIKNKMHRHHIWNSKLSKLNFYDAIIIHSYAKVVKGKNQYGQMIEEEEEGDLSISFSKYKKRIHAYFNNGYADEINNYNLVFNNLPIWITEWNLQYSKKTGNTHLQALFVANYFLELLTNPLLQNIELTTFHNLAGRDFGGSIFQMKNNNTHIQSTFIPIKMISKFFKDDKTIVSKEQINDDIYKYTFSNDNGIVSICWVNWSKKNFKTDLISNNFNKIEECYALNLYSKNSDNGAIQYKKIALRKNNLLTLKPYSITTTK
jgi:hypothetical protein